MSHFTTVSLNASGGLRRGALLPLAFLFGLAAAPAVHAQYAPNGFIQTHAWNMLFLDQAYSGDCTAGIAYPGGGPVFMKANWVAPHDIGAEDPKAGDVWADLAFVATPTPGPRSWTLGTALGESPTWVSYDSVLPLLAAGLPGPVAAPAIADRVDFNTMVDRIRQIPDPDIAATVIDNAVAIATTYVQNNTGSPIYVQIGSASDDGCRIMLNNLDVVVKSVARGIPGTNLTAPANSATVNPDFEEWSGAILPPGISRITAHVWEGGGGWELRLGIIRNGQLVKDGNADIEFLGTGAGNPAIVGQIQPANTYDFKNVNPFGWIVARGWNFLGPLDNRFGGEGGGPQLMLQNWVYPYDIVQEDPKVGDEWDIDFLLARAQGYAARDFNLAIGGEGKPFWFTYEYLNDLIGSIPGGAALVPLPGSGEGRHPYGRGDVNFDDLFRYINARVARPSGLPTIDLKDCANPADFNAGCDPDNYLMLATTYVRNKTGADLPVQVLSGSDDSAQVWINCQLVTNDLFGHGVTPFAQHIRQAVLPPGISKIAFLNPEGGGGSGLRLGLRPIGSNYNYCDGDPAIEFIGNGGNDDSIVGQKQFCLERLCSDPLFRDFDTATVTIKGNGAGNAGDEIQVVERISAFDLSQVEISDVSAGGVVSETTIDLPDMYINTSSTGGDIWNGCDSFRFDYSVLNGDFDVSAEILYRTHSGDAVLGGAGKIGLMARENLNNNVQYQMIQDFFPNPTGQARTARRRASLPLNGGAVPCGNVREDAGVGTDNTLRHPRFIRIKRVGQVVSTWVSNLPGLADGSADATLDSNWTLNLSDNWNAASNSATAANPLPDDLYVGFANSENGTLSMDIQKAYYRILAGSNNAATPVTEWQTLGTLIGTDNGGQSSTVRGGSVVVDKIITWNTTRGAANAGLTYHLKYKLQGRTSNPPLRTTIFADNAPRVVNGPPINQRLDSFFLNFSPNRSGPVGDFTAAHDFGFQLDPRTPGSTTYDESTDTYTMKGSGSDIWDVGDRMHFAYQPVEGDFVATVRITDIQNPPNARWGRTGIMARYSGDYHSKYSLACVPYRGEAPDANDARRHQFRRDHLVPGNSREQQVVPSGLLAQPYTGWARLTRQGRLVFSHFADDVDGQPGEWVFAGSDYDAQRPNTLMLGLVASSHGSAGLGGERLLTVTYDNWSVETPTVPSTSCQDLGDFYTDDFSFGLDPSISRVVVGAGTWTPTTVNERLRLTADAIASSATAVWFNSDGGLLGDSGFAAEFDAYVSNDSGATSTDDAVRSPADGFTFAVVEGTFDTSAGLVGDGGGGLGYNRGDHNAIPNSRRRSFAVEIDTWDSGSGDNDPLQKGANASLDNSYHLGLDVDMENQSCQNNIEFGQVVPPLYTVPGAPGGYYQALDGIHVEVIYDPSDRVNGTSLLEVYVTGNDGEYPRTKVLSSRGPILKGDVFFGFTGGTGGANANYEVDNLNVRQMCCEINDKASIAQQGPVNLADTPEVTLDGSASSGADGSFAYHWQVVSGNAEVVGEGPKPQLKLNGSGTVKVKLTVSDNVCDDKASAEMSFEVSCDDPPEVAKIAGAPAGTTDVNAAVFLDGTGSSAGTGDQKAITYAWSIDSGPGAIVGAADGSSVSVKGTAPGTVTVKLVVDDGRCGNAANTTASFCVDDADTAVVVVPAESQPVGTTVAVNSTGSSAGSRSWSIVSGPGEIVGASNGNVVNVKGTAPGDVLVKLTVDDGICTNPGTDQKRITFEAVNPANWVRGDTGDAKLDITDAVNSLGFQFTGAAAPDCVDALDFNVDGKLDISDPVGLLGALFLGAPVGELFGKCEVFAGCPTKCP